MVTSLLAFVHGSFLIPGSSCLSPASKAAFRHWTAMGLGCGTLDSRCSLLSHWSAFSPTASSSSSSFSTFRHLVGLLVLIAINLKMISGPSCWRSVSGTWSRVNAGFQGSYSLIYFVSATRNSVADVKRFFYQQIPLLTSRTFVDASVILSEQGVS